MKVSKIDNKIVRGVCNISNKLDAKENSYIRTVLKLGLELGIKLGSYDGKILG